MRGLFFTCCLLLAHLSTDAQTTINNYQPSFFNQSFQLVTGTSGTAVNLIGNSDDALYSVALPFDFNYNNEAYTSGSSLKVSDNGYLLFGSSLGSNSSVYTPLTTHTNCVSVIGEDLRGGVATTVDLVGGSPVATVTSVLGLAVGDVIINAYLPVGTTIVSVAAATNNITLSNAPNVTVTNSIFSTAKGSIRTEIRGTAPNRLFVIQWGFYSSYYTLSSVPTSPNYHNTFQIILHEGGGIAQNQNVQLLYGVCQAGPNGLDESSEVGLKGSSLTQTISMSGVWSFFNVNLGAVFSLLHNSTNVPVLNKSVLFSPSSCNGQPVGGTTVASSNYLCGGAPKTITFSVQGATNSFGVARQWQFSTNGINYTNISGATADTYTASVSVLGYYRRSVTCTFGNLVSFSVPLQIQNTPVPTADVISGLSTGIVYDTLFYSNTNNSSGVWQTSTDSLLWTPSVTGNIFGFLPAQAYAPLFVRNLQPEKLGCPALTSNVVKTVVTIPYDNVCNAKPLVVGSNGPFTNKGASVQANEVFPPDVTDRFSQNGWLTNTIENSTWFSFTVPQNGSRSYEISTNKNNTNNLDTEIALYAVDSCSGLLDSFAVTLIAANDDSTGSFNSRIDSALVCLVPGQTYYLQVDGYFGSTNNNFNITVKELAAPSASIAGLPNAPICFNNTASFPLVGTPAGGVFSGEGVNCISDNCSVNASTAPLGVNTITYTLSGLFSCYAATAPFEVLPGQNFYLDADGDLYGNPASFIIACTAPDTNYVTNNTDCDDTDATVNSVSTEICDAMDNDCDGIIDNVLPNVAGQSVFYLDGDGDGYGRNDQTILACSLPSGYAAVCDDCNDSNANINPGKTELNNTLDDDCSGAVNDYCANLVQPKVLFTSNSSVTIFWAAVNDAILYNIAYRAVGASTWSATIATPKEFAQISGLSTSIPYEFRYRTKCGSTFTPYAVSAPFTIPSGVGTCARPVKGGDVPISNFTTRLFWNFTPNALQYRVRYRLANQTPIVWVSKTVKGTIDNPLVAETGLANLTAGAVYLYQVQALCPGTPATWTLYSSLDSIVMPALACQAPYTAPAALVASFDDDGDITISSELQLWPNPAAHTISFGAEHLVEVSFQILDFQGRVVENGVVADQISDLDVSHLPNGVYVLRAGGQAKAFQIVR